MALEFKLDGSVLEVKETLSSWSDTRVRYWYYDISSWMNSVTGKYGATCVMSMLDEQIAWVRKYYLPRVGIQNELIETA